METSDESIVAGMKREKDEEIGSSTKILVFPNETRNLLFRKSDGSAMILPHIAGIFKSGDIQLNDEYSEYAWVPIHELGNFEPKIDTIPEYVEWAVGKLKEVDRTRLIEI